MQGSVKKHVFLWKTPKICEMRVVDLSPMPKKKNHHLCELKIIKLVEHGEFDLFFIRDYFEKLLLPLDHGIGKLQEPVGN